MSVSKTPDYKVMERLSDILRRLESGEKLSIKELSKDYGCDAKTIQRDINRRLPELLSQLNMGVRLEREGRLVRLGGDTTTLKNFDEALVLDVLEKLSEGMGSNFALKAKKILSNIKRADSEEHLYASVYFEDVTDKADEVLSLEVAMGKAAIIKYRYEINGSSYDVEAKPLKLICFDGFWYLLAEDVKDGVIKKYYLKAISNISMTEKTFTIKKALKDKLQNAVNVWFNANKESFEVRLWADKEIAKYFYRRPISKSQRVISKDPDGSIELSVMITDDNEIVPTVFYWMPNLLILSPKPLREKVEKLAALFIEKMRVAQQ
jgi:predicted DNA-binding transcriptional regulator YafY